MGLSISASWGRFLRGGTEPNTFGLVLTLISRALKVAEIQAQPDYPHWEMKPELKQYYLLQSAYWLQQLLVLALRIEKPRKDFAELAMHHVVTLWLIG
jgi:hypothetical protein